MDEVSKVTEAIATPATKSADGNDAAPGDATSTTVEARGNMGLAGSAVPLLPEGALLFRGIPARAVILEALAPAIGSGTIITDHPEALGIVLVRAGEIFESYCYTPGEIHFAAAALDCINESREDATVAASQLDEEVVELLPALLRGEPCYSDLRLSWTDWEQLLADLSSRQGTYVVEVTRPSDRGVTCIRDGRRIVTYTASHLEPGEPALLDDLVWGPEGSIEVRREPLQLADDANRPQQHPLMASDSAAVDPAATEPSTSGPSASASGPSATGVPVADPPEDTSLLDDFDNPYAAMFGAFTDPDAGYDPGTDGEVMADPVRSLTDLLPDLKRIARERLKRSAARVETLLDHAATQNRPLEDVLVEIHRLTIRGVMQSTLDGLVDEMRQLAHAGSRE